LIGVTHMLLDSGRLQWAAVLPEARVLETELANFRTKLTASMYDTYNAREGAHDDLLLALACAAWVGEYVP
jgi:hypothetical protein